MRGVALERFEKVILTIQNKLTDKARGQANSAFDLKLVTPTADYVDTNRVKITTAPTDVASAVTDQTKNGGVYDADGNYSEVKGIVAYVLPDDQNIAVIYFDAKKVCIGVKAKGTTLDASLLEDIAKQSSSYTGTFDVAGATYNLKVGIVPGDYAADNIPSDLSYARSSLLS